MERLVYRFQLDCNHIGVQRTIQGIQSGEIIARECVIGLVHGSTPIEIPTDSSVVAAMYVTRGTTTDVKFCELDVANSTVHYVFAEEDVANAGIVTMQLKLIQTGLGGAEQVLVSPKFELEIEDSDTEEDDAEDSPTFTALESALAQAQAVYNSRIVSVTTDSSYNLVITYADGTTYESDAIVDAADDAALAAIQTYITQIEGYVDTAQTASRNAATSESNAATSELHASQYEDHAEDHAEDAEAWATGKINNVDVPSTHPAYHNNAKYWHGEAFNEAQNANYSANEADGSAKDSEAWAVGKRGGVDVPSTDEAYHNNAKWYKDQAEAIVGGDGFVKYTAQTKSEADKLQARTNIGAIADIPIATTSVAGKVMPDGSTIKVSQTGQISTAIVDLGEVLPSSPTSLVSYFRTDAIVKFETYEAGEWGQGGFLLPNDIITLLTADDEGDTYLEFILFPPHFTASSGDWFAMVYSSSRSALHGLCLLLQLSGNPANNAWTYTDLTNPVATVSKAGIVKPDGESIQVDANGKIRDYGNSWSEDTEYSNITYIEAFKNGWHKIYSGSSSFDYSQLPITETEAGEGSAVLHIVTDDESCFTATLVYQADSDGATRMWVVPFFNADDDTLTSSDWIEIDNVVHKPSSAVTSGTLTQFGSDNEIASSGITASTVLTTGNSAKVVISNSAPSDTTALWVK